MAELGEAVAAAVSHEEDGSDACPFCPRPNQESFVTFAGKENDSAVLAAIMEQPDRLVAKQKQARPKDGENQRQFESDPNPRPAKAQIFQNKHGPYSYEAHHLISGNQALKGHEIEGWICKGNLAAKDTGYSVNNSDNGEWLPSIPEKYKGGSWSPLSLAAKKEIAYAAMEAGKGQFHKGPHNITDDDDPNELHTTYPIAVKRLLTDLYEVIRGWTAECPVTQGLKPPYEPNWHVHDMLDAVSRVIRVDLRGPVEYWEYFISRLAMAYHLENCGDHDEKM